MIKSMDDQSSLKSVSLFTKFIKSPSFRKCYIIGFVSVITLTKIK